MDEVPEEDSAGETPGGLLKKFLEGVVEGAEDFTRRRPMEGILLSLLAGVLVSDLLRRNR